MNTWTPLWSKVVDSSLWRESDLVVKIFLTMLAKKDSDHVVRGSAFNIGEWAKKTEAEALEALAILSSPDKRRIEKQPFDGRRVEKVEDGWLILNGDFYRDMVKREMTKARNRKSQKAWRERQAVGSGNAKAAERRMERNENLGGTEFADKAQAIDES